jgi:hypothetical protein
VKVAGGADLPTYGGDGSPDGGPAPFFGVAGAAPVPRNGDGDALIFSRPVLYAEAPALPLAPLVGGVDAPVLAAAPALAAPFKGPRGTCEGCGAVAGTPAATFSVQPAAAPSGALAGVGAAPATAQLAGFDLAGIPGWLWLGVLIGGVLLARKR